MPKESLASHSAEWYHLFTSVRNNAEELPYLLDLCSELQLLADRTTTLHAERCALDARRQQISRDLDTLKNRARVVATKIRSGLRTKYGYGSEKLAEFKMQPRRRPVEAERQEAELSASLQASASDPESDKIPT
ncbi:MAG TPA: hypothetical protein VF756_24840 [Thermoanaerobaculia bacterium]